MLITFLIIVVDGKPFGRRRKRLVVLETSETGDRKRSDLDTVEQRWSKCCRLFTFSIVLTILWNWQCSIEIKVQQPGHRLICLH
jgi:hypothetical protein